MVKFLRRLDVSFDLGAFCVLHNACGSQTKTVPVADAAEGWKADFVAKCVQVQSVFWHLQT